MYDLDLSDKIAIINWSTLLFAIIISVINDNFVNILFIYSFLFSGVLSFIAIIESIKELKLKKAFLKKVFLILNISYFTVYVGFIFLSIFISGAGV